jgi:xanthine dehydrogenase accessory factor
MTANDHTDTADEPAADTDDPVEQSTDGSARPGSLESREHDLQARREPYARATIVRREPPVSANVGDRALVTSDGELIGWIGGAGCAQSRVIKESKAALEDGEPRLIGIAPDPDEIDRPGLSAFPMYCHSEGTLEVFIEPVIPTTKLLVVGGSPIARSLLGLAAELDFDAMVVDPDADEDDLPEGTTVVRTHDPEAIADAVGPNPLVVIASMGGYDARGVAAGMLTEAPYIGLIASTTRAEEVIAHASELVDCDPDDVRAAVTNPAGLDIGARSSAEIAASLLAELIAVRADAGALSETVASTGQSGAESDTNSAVDPVCGMTVDPADSPSVDHAGQTYYFCCSGCADSFSTDPEEYLDVDSSAEGAHAS